MREFPHLGLGGYCIFIPLVFFILIFILSSILGVVVLSRSKMRMVLNIALSLSTSLLAAVGIVIFLYSCIGPYAISEIHRAFNRHMPKPGTCTYYSIDFSELQADYRVSEEVMRAWVEKYSLRELAPNEVPHSYFPPYPRMYRSKSRPNGSMMLVGYNPAKQIASFRYNAW
jgi:energy-coupling factor transporter transmembrane protein EcfT